MSETPIDSTSESRPVDQDVAQPVMPKTEDVPRASTPVETQPVETPTATATEDAPMHDGSTTVRESTSDDTVATAPSGGIKRQSSHDSHDNEEDRAVKRVKEDHPDAIADNHTNGVSDSGHHDQDASHSPHPAQENGNSGDSPPHAMSQDSPSSPPTPAAETPQAETPQPNHQPLTDSQPQANGVAPPIYVPGSFQPPYREPFGPSSPLTANQCKSLLAIVKQLKRAREAGPFNNPVDPIAFNIPHYTNIIHKPMDLSTVETKLTASNPALPKDKNRPVKKDMSQGTYANVQEVVEDVRQIWNNTRIFNGPQHAVSLNADKLDEQFETAIKKAKLGEETSARAASATQAPVFRRHNSDEGESARPKREIHPPTPKDSTWGESGNSKRKGRASEEEKIRAVSKVLDELMFRKQYMDVVGAFLYPVDPVALNIPDYPRIIKTPMDMSTISSRISQHQYNTAQEIYNDFKLMLNNCFTYNPPGTPVHEVGRQLERVWQEKWNNTAVLHSKGDAEEEEDEFAGVDVEAEIRTLEKQVSDMTYRLTRLRAYRSKHHEKARAKASAASHAAAHAKTSKTAATNHASTSKPSNNKMTSARKTAPASKPRKQSTSNGNAGHKKPTYDYDDEEEVFEDVAPVNVSLAQKQELADKIGEVDHTTLQSALEIISATTSVQDGNDEIELDIDALPAHTVYKLYNLVVLGYPKGQPPKKKAAAGAAGSKRQGGAAAGSSKRTGGGGGARRGSKQNGNEKDRIRALEAQLASLEQHGGGDHDDGDNSSVVYSEEDSDEE